MEYKKFNYESLVEKDINKGKLAELIGLESEGVTYDTALPQDWVDKFARWVQTILPNTFMTYHTILFTTFWVYDKESRIFGKPVSGCTEVDATLKLFALKRD